MIGVNVADGADALTESADARTAVYRLFGSDDVLLYIGMSGDPEVRWQQHSYGRKWWPDVRRETVRWYDTRDEAAAAEKAAIRAERPKYNLRHNLAFRAGADYWNDPVWLPWPRLSPQCQQRDLHRQNPGSFQHRTIRDSVGDWCGLPFVDGECRDHGVVEYEMIVTEHSRSHLPIEELRAAGETVRWNSRGELVPSAKSYRELRDTTRAQEKPG